MEESDRSAQLIFHTYIARSRLSMEKQDYFSSFDNITFPYKIYIKNQRCIACISRKVKLMNVKRTLRALGL